MEPSTSVTPLDELAGFLSGNSASSVSPQNPLSQNADPSASASNPNMNPANPTAWANPSNPELNPNLPGAVNNPSNPKYNPSMPGATNNPSNYEYNAQMPGSLTNPAQPNLNPIYPGSMMNPANPIHNPDYPVHQEYERPPGLSDNASLPPAHASWHEATWVPGMDLLRQKLQQHFHEIAQENPELFNGGLASQAIEKCLAEYEAEMSQQRQASVWDEPPRYGGTWQEIRQHIAQKPWIPGTYGKGFITPSGRPVSWQVERKHNMAETRSNSDLWPAHIDGMTAVGYPPRNDKWTTEGLPLFQIDREGGIWHSQEPESYDDQELTQHPVYQAIAQHVTQQGVKPNPYFSDLEDEEDPEHTERAAGWRTADNYTQDSREWPDPTEPRADAIPSPHGCICRNGTDGAAKLHCPVHGLDGQWELAMDWSIPEGHPVGYPEDQPRGWTDAVHSKTFEGRTVLEAQVDGPWDGVDHAKSVEKHANQEHDHQETRDGEHGADNRHGATLPVKKQPVKLNKFFTTHEQHERGKRRWFQRQQQPKKKAALDPRHLQTWMDTAGPYLYHATDSAAGNAILRDGLYPHDYEPELPEYPEGMGEFEAPYSRSQWADQFYRPRSGHVYLGTRDRAGYYGGGAGSGGRRVFRVDLSKLDPALVNPDEDAFGGDYRDGHYPQVDAYYHSEDGYDTPPSPHDYEGDGGETFGDWADRVNLGQDPEDTKHSLFAHGSIAYNGVVPPHLLEEVSPHSYEPLRVSPMDQQQPQMAMAKIEEHDAKLAAMDEFLGRVSSHLRDGDKRPRKLIIRRDEHGRMASIEEA